MAKLTRNRWLWSSLKDLFLKITKKRKSSTKTFSKSRRYKGMMKE